MRRVLVITACLALLLPKGPALGATPSSGHVSNAAVTANWTGPTFIAGTYTGGDRGGACFDASGQPLANPPTTGSSACDVFTLFVDVPSTFWTNTAGGVAVRLDN